MGEFAKTSLGFATAGSALAVACVSAFAVTVFPAVAPALAGAAAVIAFAIAYRLGADAARRRLAPSCSASPTSWFNTASSPACCAPRGIASAA